MRRKPVSLAAVAAALVLAAAWGGGAAASARAANSRASSSKLVVGLGDSLASGEGNPDVPKSGNDDARWDNRRCDRSNNSFEARVVARLRENDPGTQVDFKYLACSGATIEKGLLGPYAGINPEETDLPGQVDEARRLLGDRKADAVLLSIGVNDLGFGEVASFCAFLYENYCPDADYKHNPTVTLAEWVKQKLDALPARYDQLATALEPLVAAGHVFIAEYPDVVSRSPDALCKVISFTPPLEIPERSIDWLYHNFYLPLNAEIRAAAEHHGWRVINASAAFEDHGYCTNDSWVVSYEQSEARQGDANGALHPNLQGQTEITNAFYPVVRDALKNG